LPALVADADGRLAPTPAPPAAVRAVPAATQEALLVEEVLDAALGAPGRWVRAAWAPATGAARGRGARGAAGHPVSSLVFTLAGPADALDPALCAAAERLLPLGPLYLRCLWAAENRSAPEAGRVSHALAAAIRLVLREFELTVAQLEAATRREGAGMTLPTLYVHALPALRTLEALDALLAGAATLRGGALLAALDAARRTAGDDARRELAAFLLERAAAPFLAAVGRWVFYGELDDGGAQGGFLVREAAAPSGGAAHVWATRFTLDATHVPGFLAPHAARVLVTGKYLCALREAVSEMPGARAERATRANPAVAPLAFSPDPRAYDAALSAAHAWAAAALLRFVRDECGLLARLASIKGYFLVYHGDYLSHFMDVAAAELSKATDPTAGLGLTALARSRLLPGRGGRRRGVGLAAAAAAAAHRRGSDVEDEEGVAGWRAQGGAAAGRTPRRRSGALAACWATTTATTAAATGSAATWPRCSACGRCWSCPSGRP
jgi:gamma-tubulin complex component 2